MAERLNWGCGPDVREGWHNSDERWYPGMRTDESYPHAQDHLGRIQYGLPWADGFFDYVVSHHALQMLPEQDLVPALAELRRVTKPGGWLRLGVPDLVGAVEAWACGSRSWFPVDAPDVDTAFCLYVTQGGSTRSVFIWPRMVRLLTAAGWHEPREVAYGLSVAAEAVGITELDNRPDETLYMEARK